jgi:hypothetical protein
MKELNMKWISLKEPYPEDWVLVAIKRPKPDKFQWAIARYDKDDWKFIENTCCSCSIYVEEITHYIPLPALPKENE